MKKFACRIAVAALLAGGTLVAASPHANALGIVRDGCSRGNYWFMTENGDGSYGWGIIYRDRYHCP